MASLGARLRRAWAVLVGGRAFEAAQASPQHQPRPFNSAQSPDAAMEMANSSLLEWGRYLDENHDLAIGVIDDLVTNVVGTGIHVEPLPRLAGRESNPLAERILELWDEWTRAPEVTTELGWGELQRISCRAWLRDGEFFCQHVDALAAYDWPADSVRYRLEFLESEMVARDLYVNADNYRQGIWLNSWNRPLVYAVYRRHPNDFVRNNGRAPGTLEDIKRVPAEQMMHVKFTRRWPQTRGVPITHGIIRRLQDLKDYEESERIAARVAASLTAYIRKGPDYVAPSNVSESVSGERELSMQAGMIFDDLVQGEDIGTIDTNRPNSELGNFRSQMVRALAAGTGTRYSSIAKDYSGTYASQRQELVEAKPHYDRLREHYINRFVRPTYEAWLQQAWLQGMLGVPSSVPFRDLARAEYIGPGMPWIDPLKEVQADALRVAEGFSSRPQVIRERGGDPRMVAASEAAEPRLRPVETDDDADSEGSEDAAAAS